MADSGWGIVSGVSLTERTHGSRYDLVLSVIGDTLPVLSESEEKELLDRIREWLTQPRVIGR